MAEFGDEFIIESYRTIPWLIILIQLVVTILVIIVLFFGFNSIFNIINSDPSATFTATAAAAPPQLDKPSSSNTQRSTKVEGHRAKRDARTSEESAREDDAVGEESPQKESMFLRSSQSSKHPCTYMVLVKEAVLKCLGLDFSSESSCNHQNERKE